MRYSVMGFRQDMAISLGLDLTDLLILQHFIEFVGTGRMVEHVFDGETYYWISYTPFLQQLPIIGITNANNLYRRLLKIVSAGLLKKVVVNGSGQKCYYRPTKALSELKYDYKIGPCLPSDEAGPAVRRDGACRPTGRQPAVRRDDELFYKDSLIKKENKKENVQDCKIDTSAIDETIPPSPPPTVDDQATPVHDNSIFSPPAPRKKKRKKLAEDSSAFKLAERMYEVLKQRNPEISLPNMQGWARDMDLMLRVDKRTPSEIEGKLLGIQDDSFWWKVILSPGKLRQKWKEGKLAHIRPKISDKQKRIIEACSICTDEEYFESYGEPKPYTKEEADELFERLFS